MNKRQWTMLLGIALASAACAQTESRDTTINAVRVRGNTSLTGANDPLVIIDGVTSDLATLSTIYPCRYHYPQSDPCPESRLLIQVYV